MQDDAGADKENSGLPSGGVVPTVKTNEESIDNPYLRPVKKPKVRRKKWGRNSGGFPWTVSVMISQIAKDSRLQDLLNHLVPRCTVNWEFWTGKVMVTKIDSWKRSWDYSLNQDLCRILPRFISTIMIDTQVKAEDWSTSFSFSLFFCLHWPNPKL